MLLLIANACFHGNATMTVGMGYLARQYIFFIWPLLSCCKDAHRASDIGSIKAHSPHISETHDAWNRHPVHADAEPKASQLVALILSYPTTASCCCWLPTLHLVTGQTWTSGCLTQGLGSVGAKMPWHLTGRYDCMPGLCMTHRKLSCVALTACIVTPVVRNPCGT